MSAMLRPFRLLIALSFLFIAACGDDPSNPDDDDGNPPGEEIPAAERVAALEEVADRLEQIAAENSDPAALNAAIAAYLETRPEFQEVGIDEEALTVYAVFTDGRGLIIPNNLFVGGAAGSVPRAGGTAAHDARPRAGARESAGDFAVVPNVTSTMAAIDPPELPVSRTARLLHTFSAGTAFEAGSIEAIGEMALMLSQAGWQPTTGGVAASTVEALRAVSGDGFFYLNTHGGPGRTWYGTRIEGVYAVQTSSIVTPLSDTDEQTEEDLEEGRLVYIIANADGGEDSSLWDYDARYAITPKFVEHYMSFSPNAVVFLNACESGHEAAVPTALANAFRAKGASVVLGWSRAVPASIAWDAAKYLVDRMTGANRFDPEDSKHRPFPLDDVLQWMKYEGHAKVGELELRAIGPASGAGFGLLRPTIERMQIDTSAFGAPFGVPFGMLTIHGEFGTDPGAANRRVFIRQGGETELQVHSWTPDSIRVVPVQDEDAPGFSGDVVVVVRERTSNARRLHAWEGTVTYTQTALGALVFDADLEVVGRFDPDSTRAKPGEPAQANSHPSVFRAQPVPSLEAPWSASGSVATEQCTVVWSGSGTVVSSDPAPNRAYIFHGQLNPGQHEFLLKNHQLSVEYTQTCGTSIVLPFSATSMAFLQPGAPDLFHHFQVTEQWQLTGRTFTLTGDGVQIVYTWPDIDPFPTYDPAQPK